MTLCSFILTDFIKGVISGFLITLILVLVIRYFSRKKKQA